MRKTDLLCDGLEAAAAKAGVAVTTNRVPGMFGLFFTDQKVESFAQATTCDVPAFNRFFHGLLKRGVYFAPSAYEAGFISAAHSDADIAATVAAAAEAFVEARRG
jgi:glutamate-1-semialdehyde 2,1-aminomutase